ncbi:hypothetical protein DZA29_16630 [Citrobacter gillenii]|nr:hypothetical protein DZA29_16630 [Citrobacter gillenii]
MSGFEGEIFKQGGGHYLLSRMQKTAVGYLIIRILSLVKRALSILTVHSCNQYQITSYISYGY